MGSLVMGSSGPPSASHGAAPLYATSDGVMGRYSGGGVSEAA